VGIPLVATHGDPGPYQSRITIAPMVTPNGAGAVAVLQMP
jgi:hypothetical protein